MDYFGVKFAGDIIPALRDLWDFRHNKRGQNLGARRWDSSPLVVKEFSATLGAQ